MYYGIFQTYQIISRGRIRLVELNEVNILDNINKYLVDSVLKTFCKNREKSKSIKNDIYLIFIYNNKNTILKTE